MLRFLRRRNRVGSKAGRVAAILSILVVVCASPNTAAADDVDIRDVLDGNVEGLTVQVNGSGLGYYGDSLRANFVNTTDRPIRVKIPLGLRFVPNDSGVQTMIAAGGEIVVVPPGDSESLLKAFCGEMNDSAPGAGDVFTAGEMVGGDLLRTVENLNREGRFDSTGNSTIWSLTDDLNLDGDPEAQRLVRTTTSPARTAAGGALTGAVIAGGAVIHARMAGSGKRPTVPGPAVKDVLVDTKATEWLIDDGAKTITHDGKTYVIPPPRIPPNTDGIAYETITVNGVDVIDENKVAVIPHRDGPVDPPKNSPPPPTPVAPVATADPTVTPETKQPGNVKLTKPEQQHIIDWGVKNQRTPDEIQKDLDSQNESQGGSGTVPVADMPTRLKLPQGDVTVTAAEAAAHQHQIEDIKTHDNQVREIQTGMTDARQELDKWIKEDLSLEYRTRMTFALIEIFRHNNRMTDPSGYLLKLENRDLPEAQRYSDLNDMLTKKYNRPVDMLDSGWQDRVRQWNQGPEAARYHERLETIRRDALHTLQDFARNDMYNVEATGLYNRAAKKIQFYNEHREKMIETLREINGKKAALREMERQFAERLKKAP